MSMTSGYWLSPQQEQAVDAIALAEPAADASGEAGTIAAGYSRAGVGRVQLIVRPAQALGLETLIERVRLALAHHHVLCLRLVPRAGARRPLQTCVAPGSVDPAADGVVIDLPNGDVKQAATQQWQQPFDLTRELPLRVVRVSGDDGVRLVITASALALDTPSAVMLAGALCAPEAVPEVEDEEALDWFGASTFFREWLEDEDDEEARADRAYFAEPSGEPPPWPRVAPTDDADASGSGYERFVIPLPPTLVARVGETAEDAEAMWIAIFLGFLARTGSTAQPALRVASSGREAMDELAPLLGPLARWLPVSVRIAGDDAIAHLALPLATSLEQAREHELGYRERPVNSNQGWRPGDGPTALPAFAWVDADLGGCGGVVEHVRVAATDAPWTLLLVDGGPANAPQLALEIDVARVAPAAVEALTASLATWLRAVDRQGIGARLCEYPLVEPSAPSPTADIADAPLFLERFLAAADQHAASPAVVDDTQSVPYGELETASAALGAELRAAGASATRPVAIVLTRTHHAITAMLGAMRAGAPFLPLDPALPQAALRARLEDAGAAIVLTESLLTTRIPGEWPQRALDGVPPAPIPTDRSHEASLPLPSGEAPAYLLYTSGSTGTPKAVVVTHRQLAEYVRAIEQVVDVGAGARWGNLSTLAADLGHTTLFPPLVSGGTIRLLGEEAMGNARVLGDALREAPLDVLKIVPSHLGALLDGAGDAQTQRAILPRQVLLCGGEALPRALVDRVAETVPTVLNHYGPTETTVGAVVGDARAGSAEAAGAVPIGHALGHARLYVLDRYGWPVPDGVVGELFIGGPTVAEGYHNRPVLTAARFLPDPFAEAPGARMYRTGDRVRRLADGALAYLGRTDFQLKVRGFRVEPEEIEAVIAAHLDVAQVAVGPAGQQTGADLRLAAWVAPSTGKRLESGALREWVRTHLPVYMRPGHWVFLRTLPLTGNGKIDRQALPAPEAERPDLETHFVAPRGRVERDIAAIWAELLGLERVGVEDNFFDLGGHSLLLVQLMSRLESRFAREILITELFRYPTVAAQARWIGDQPAAGPRTASDGAPTASSGRASVVTPPVAHATDARIAVVGLAARFPEAPTVDAFWEHLRSGRDGVRRLDTEALRAAGVDERLLNDPRYVAASPVLDDIELFDASFFSISPRQAQIMDPQHRLLMELAWTAMEHAGIAPGREAGRVGVFAGAGLGSYFLTNLATSPALLASVGATAVRHANRIDNLATRIAYHLDLDGPAVTVQSGCSSSLVAVHLAAQSLRSGDADVALAGGVTVNALQGRGYRYQPGGINSPDGRCRAFDAQAAGTVFGSGLGMVVLKRLDDARADGDTVHAVLLGSAMNNDGAGKPGYSAPGLEGQASVISHALARAGVAPQEIDFVEAHGTGTLIGDPIEVTALTQAYGGQQALRGTTWLGTVKSNIGHLDAAAGVAGFIKAVLALSHGEVPPTLHFEQPNPRLALEQSPFKVVTACEPLTRPPPQRRAGVSSFGIGGTNVHAVLGGPPPAPARAATALADEARLTWLTLSAHREEALAQIGASLADQLERRPDLTLDDVAWTLATGRRAHALRRAVLCVDRQEAIRALRGERPEHVHSRTALARDASVTLLFPGQGAQTPGMAAQPYASDAVFREAFEEVLQAMEAALARVGVDVPQGLRTLLLDPHAADGEALLARTECAQPALFVLELALARAWSARGVHPGALLGHSLGELVAATHAGVFTLEDAAYLVALRGQLLAAQPKGNMLAVRARRDEVEALLAREESPDVHVSAVNGSTDVTVGGDEPSITAFAALLDAQGVRYRQLPTSHAFHVPAMAPAVEPFHAALAGVERQPPNTPIVSAHTGRWMSAEQAQDPAFWAAQLVSPVRFADALTSLVEATDAIGLEAGPGRALTTLAARHGELSVVPTLPGDANGGDPLTQATSALWLRGAKLDFAQALAGGRGRRVPLPTYPFARERHWVDPVPGADLFGLRSATPAAIEPHTVATDGAVSPPETVAKAAPAMRSTPYVAPAGDLEQSVAQIWEQVLGIAEIGRNDDFFELGGDSLQALQVLALLQEAGFGVDPADLFESQTVGALTAVLRPVEGEHGAAAAGASDDETATRVIPTEYVRALNEARTPEALVASVQRRGSARPRRIVSWTTQQRRWLAAGGAPVHVGLAAPDEAQGRALSEAALAAAAHACTRRHGCLRLRAAHAQGDWVQRLVSEAQASWLVATHTLSPERTRTDVLREIARTLDPVAGPVAAAIRLEADEAVELAVLVHGLVADAWSVEPLLGDLIAHLAASADAPAAEVATPDSAGADPGARCFAEHADASLLRALEAPAPTTNRHTDSKLPRDMPLGEARAGGVATLSQPLACEPESLPVLVAAVAEVVGEWKGVAQATLAVAVDERDAVAYPTGAVGAYTRYVDVQVNAALGSWPPTVETVRAALDAAVDGMLDGYDQAAEVLVRECPAIGDQVAGWSRLRAPVPAPWSCPKARRHPLLEIDVVRDASSAPGVHLAITYSPQVHRADSVAELAANTAAILQRTAVTVEADVPTDVRACDESPAPIDTGELAAAERQANGGDAPTAVSATQINANDLERLLALAQTATHDERREEDAS
ncbi:MAG: amino acid adenylation domain-containing protein [Pseudomonadota bacterium]